MNWLYLSALLVSFSGMAVIDRRYSLAFFKDSKRTLLTVLVSVGVFVVWDIAGIVSGIFYSGNSPYMSRLYLGPEFPIEELVFLTFLSYFTLIMYRFWSKRWPRT